MLNHRPFAVPGPRQSPEAVHARAEYPSIGEFLDELPPIEDFLGEAIQEQESSFAAPPLNAASPEESGDDWLTAGWSSFDFNSLSELSSRTPGRQRPAVEIPSTRRGVSEPYSTSAPGPSAAEIAAALDGVANRIRSGTLVIRDLDGAPPEAAMAAAIAALLRTRG